MEDYRSWIATINHQPFISHHQPSTMLWPLLTINQPFIGHHSASFIPFHIAPAPVPRSTRDCFSRNPIRRDSRGRELWPVLNLPSFLRLVNQERSCCWVANFRSSWFFCLKLSKSCCWVAGFRWGSWFSSLRLWVMRWQMMLLVKSGWLLLVVHWWLIRAGEQDSNHLGSDQPAVWSESWFSVD